LASESNLSRHGEGVEGRSEGSPASFRAGLVSTLALAPGVIAFALVYGFAARQVGLSSGQTWLMSLAVFAGAAQFSALQVWSTSGGGMVVLVTLVVNLRYLLMSASIAPYLRGLSRGRRMLAAFTLSDESYALATARYAAGSGSSAYLLGANLGLYFQWGMASLAGALLGRALPDLGPYRLDLIFPLAFLGLLVPLVRDRISLAVAVVAGGLALAGSVLLPGKWYIVLSGLAASLVGVASEVRWKHS